MHSCIKFKKLVSKYFNWGEPERAPLSQYNGRNVYIYIYMYVTVRHSVNKRSLCSLTYGVQIFA